MISKRQQELDMRFSQPPMKVLDMIISNTQKQWKMRIDGFFYHTACAHTTNRPANLQTASLSCTHCRKNNVWHWAPAPQGHRPHSILPGVSLWCIYLHVSSLMHASQKVTRCVFSKWKELHFFSYLKVLDSLGWMESLFWNCKAWQSLTIWLPFVSQCNKSHLKHLPLCTEMCVVQ